MRRLILIPQYPAKLRYQEWWFTEFPKRFAKYYDMVIVLKGKEEQHQAHGSDFSPLQQAIDWEMEQIKQYMELELLANDTLLLCDLSYPGFFANVLFHKRPHKCFAICHATSKNKYDYFSPLRGIKYPIEKKTAQLFNAVFVATDYHRMKLGWSNIIVNALPFPPNQVDKGKWYYKRNHNLICVSRPGVQKRTAAIEKAVEIEFKETIMVPKPRSWEEYHEFLADSKIMLITGKEETFGYQIIDAVLWGCIPLAPNGCSYPELLPEEFIYTSVSNLICIINNILYINPLVPTLKKKVVDESFNFYKNIAKHMII